MTSTMVHELLQSGDELTCMFEFIDHVQGLLDAVDANVGELENRMAGVESAQPSKNFLGGLFSGRRKSDNAGGASVAWTPLDPPLVDSAAYLASLPPRQQ